MRTKTLDRFEVRIVNVGRRTAYGADIDFTDLAAVPVIDTSGRLRDIAPHEAICFTFSDSGVLTVPDSLGVTWTTRLRQSRRKASVDLSAVRDAVLAARDAR